MASGAADTRRPGVHWNWPVPPAAGWTPASGDKSGGGLGKVTTSDSVLVPNLYDLILEIGSDAGLEAFFDNVVRVLEHDFGADRASICVPTDPTDIVNIPWGLKALWNRDRALKAPESWRNGGSAKRTGAGVVDGECDGMTTDESLCVESSILDGKAKRKEKVGDDDEDDEDAWKTDEDEEDEPPAPHRIVFPKLRSLEFEQDPLVDAHGVVGLLEQNESSVLLQRRYFETDTGAREWQDSEQQLYSPWTRSPAPSPAVREYAEPPFFARAQEMEDAFNSGVREHPSPPAEGGGPGAPSSASVKSVSDPVSVRMPTPMSGDASRAASTDSSGSSGTSGSLSSNVGPLDAIGWEDTYSLIHVLLVVSSGSGRGGATQHRRQRRAPSAPIAILSFRSTLIPFPGKLRGLLTRLAPYLASSFLQANVQNNLTRQVAYMAQQLNAASARRRPSHSELSMSPCRRNSDYQASAGVASQLRASLACLDRQHRRLFSSFGDDEDAHKTLRIVLNGGESAADSCDETLTSVSTDRRRRHRGHRRLRQTRVARPRAYGAVGLAGDGEPGSAESKHAATAAAADAAPGVARSPFELSRPTYALLKTIVEAIPAHVFTVDPTTGDVSWVSNRALAFRGVSAEEFCRNPAKSLHPDDQSTYLESWHDALRTGLPWGRLLRVRRFDGRFKEFIIRAVPLKDEKGLVTHWFCTMMDIHRQKQAHIAAFKHAHETAADDRYQKLAESSPIIVFTLEPGKGVVYANRKWHEYSGLTAEQTYGYQYIQAVHPDDRADAGAGGAPSAFDQHVRDGGDSYSAELRLRSRDGEYRWHLTLFTRSDAMSATGDAHLWFGTCTDIHDQKLLQEKLREAKDAAQRTIESKTRFLSNMSHEIRTPLIGISGMISFLLDTPLTEEQLDYCHTISSSSEALLMVINDILDLSKVESGKMTLAYEWFKVRRLVEETNELLSSMAMSKNLELNYVINDRVPVWIKGDRIRLRQVMLNLIGNAIKFTDKGEIYTYCTLEEQVPAGAEPGEAMLRIEVHDTGRGFNPEDAERIFAPYSQLQDAYYRPTNGTGLGLVISQQLIQLHGGELTCKSEKDKGSTFNVTCRIRVPSEAEAPAGDLRGDRLPERPSSSSQALLSSNSGTASSAAAAAAAVPPKFAALSGDTKPQTASSHLTAVPESTPAPGLSPAESMRILVACPLKFTTTSIIHHIRATLQDPSRCDIMTVDSYANAVTALSNDDGASADWRPFTHIIINLLDMSESARLLQFARSVSSARLVVITSPAQKTTLNRALSADEAVRQSVTFLEKPTKPSRYSVVFDPAKRREESYDSKMASAHAAIRTQKSVFNELGAFARSGQFRILVAEDNLVNQKVMSKFLVKAGFECDLSVDGVDCTSKFFAAPEGHYDLILCDLDMPRKDGFQTCIDIRAWEAERGAKPGVPIVALSAYVMSDVAERCTQVGFTHYISKPVEFAVLKDAIIAILGDRHAPS